MTPEAGDRIELVFMDDPCPIRPGTRGVVRGVRIVGDVRRGGFAQVDVDWDNGRSLMLSVPPDVVRILPQDNPPQPDHVWDQIFRDLIDNGLTISEAARRYDVTAQAISARLKKRPFLKRLYFSLPHARRPYEGPDMDAGGPPIGVNPRTVDRSYGADRGPGRKKPTPCAICGEPTRHGKKYCTEHLEQSSYAAGLMERMEAQEREVTEVRRKGKSAIAEDSDVMAEILDALEARNGTATINQLAVDFPALGEKVIEEYVKRAIADGQAFWTFQGRKNLKKVTIDYALRYVGTREMADLAGISEEHLRILAKEHGAPHKKLKHAILWNPDELIAWHDEYLERVRADQAKQARSTAEREFERRRRYLEERGLYSTEDLSDELGMSPSHLRGLAREEGAPHGRWKNDLVWNKDEFLTWHEGYLQRQREKSSQRRKEIWEEKVRARQKGHRGLIRRELAEALGVGLSTVDHWLRKTDVPHDLVGEDSAGRVIRLFNADEVREWYEDYKERSRKARSEGNIRYGPELYEQIVDYLRAGHSYNEASERFGPSAKWISEYIRSNKIQIEPQRGHRRMTRQEVAEALGVSPVTVYAWVRKGAPHDRVPEHAGSEREILLFDADEVREWKEEYSKRPKKKTGPPKKKRPAKKKAVKKKAKKKRATKKKATKKRSKKR